MKKRIASAMLALMVLLSIILSGCLANLANQSSSDLQSGDITNSADDAMSLDEYGSMRMYRRRDYFSFAAKGGYYEMKQLSHADGSYAGEIILFSNYTTRQQTVLCQKEACAHNDENCNAYVPGQCDAIFLADERLVVVYNVLGAENEAATVIIAFYSHDGGSAPEILFQKESENEYNIYSSVWLTDDAFIYGYKAKYPAEHTEEGETRTLFSIDISTGEEKDIKNFDNMTDISGTHNSKIIMSKYKKGEGAGYINRQDLFAVDNSGETEMLYEDFPIGYSTRPHIIDNDYIYYAPHVVDSNRVETQSILRYSLQTKQEEQVVGVEEGRFYNLYGIWDNKLVYSKTFSGNQDGEAEYMWQDLSDGRTGALTLYETHESDWGGALITISSIIMPLADEGAYYLVLTGFSNADDNIINSYSLILKEDFWNNKANYIPIVSVI